MKKLSFLLLVFALGTNIVTATTITPAVAQKVAENFYKEFSKQSLKNSTLAYTEKSSAGDVVFYVFNVNENDGFIIVAADDKALPIINYSSQGKFIIPTPKINMATIEGWDSKKWAAHSAKG